jgi:hypothetical protein
LGPFPLLPAKNTSQKHKTHLPAVSGGGFSTTARFKDRFLDFEPPGASAHLCTTRTTTGGEVAARVEVRQHLKNHTTELAELQRILHSNRAGNCSEMFPLRSESRLIFADRAESVISGYCPDEKCDAGMELRYSILALLRVPWREERETLNDLIVHFE